jgi:hypothetical protein
MQAIQSRDDGGAGLQLVDRRLGSLLKRGGDVANIRLNRGWELLEFCALFFPRSRRAPAPRQQREATPMIARPRRVNDGIEGEKGGLVRDPADSADDLADFLRAPLHFGDELDRGAPAKAVALDGAHGGADPDRGFREDDLDGLRATPRGFGLRAAPRRGWRRPA